MQVPQYTNADTGSDGWLPVLGQECVVLQEAKYTQPDTQRSEQFPLKMVPDV